MNSLREEIQNIIEGARTETYFINTIPQEQYHNDKFYTDKIISEIEKRIDSIPMPILVDGIYTKKQLEDLARYLIGEVKEMLK